MGVIAEESVRIRANTSGFHSEVSSGVLRSVARVGAAAAAVFGGIKLGKALFVDPIKSAGDFEQSLNVLKATSGATDAQMKKISATAMKLGADVKLPAVSASDAANAMLELAKGGFTAGQSMEAARGVLLLSTAAEIDGATAARLVADGLHAFGMEANQAGTLVDDFAGAANASTASMSEVAQALQQSGQAFHQLGIPAGDAATAIAAMANAGIKGSDAGTSLKTMLMRLNPTTKQAKQAFAEMNVDVFDSHGKFIGLDATIKQFQPRLAAMTQEQRAHALQVIFGSDASRAANVILGMSAKKFDELRDKVTKAGQAQKLADAQTKGFNGQMKALGSAVETLQLKIGLALLPRLTQFVRFLGRIASAPNLTVAIRIIWRGVSSMVGDLAKSISDMLFGSTSTKQVVSRGMVRVGREAVTVDPGLVAHIGDMLARQDWAGIGKRIGDSISKSIKVSTDALNGVLNGMLTWVDAHKGQIADIGIVIGLTMLSKLMDPGFWAAHWQLIGGVALSALSIMFPAGRLGVIGVRALGFLLKPFEMIGVRLAALGAEGVLRLATAIEGAVGPLGGRIALWIGSAILRATTASVSAMVNLGARIIEALINKIAGLNLLFRTAMFTAVVAVIGNLIGAAVSKAGQLAVGIANAIKATPGKISGLAGTLVTAVVGAVTGITGAAFAAASHVAERIAAGVKTAPSKLAGLAGDLLGRIASAAGQAAGQAFSAMRQVGFSIADGVISGIGNLGGRLASAVGSAAKNAVSGAISAISGGSPSRLYADTVGESIASGVSMGAVRGLNDLAPKLGTRLREIAHQVAVMTKANSKEAADAFKQWATDAKTAFDDGMKGLEEKLHAQLDRAKKHIEAWKARLTPAEVQLKTEAAQKALRDLQTSLNTAWNALKGLPQQQATEWAKLLADQRKQMEGLLATQTTSTMNAGIAEHEFGKSVAANQAEGNQPALNLLQAKQNLETWKQYYAEGKVTLDDVLRYQDAYDQNVIATQQAHDAAIMNAKIAHDAAILAAGENADAKALADQQLADATALADKKLADGDKLLQDYTTWQELALQSSAAGTAIADAEQANYAARLDLQTNHSQQTIDAQNAVNLATEAIHTDDLNRTAARQRAHHDLMARELDAALIARYKRYDNNLTNIRRLHDQTFDTLAGWATKSGGDIAENLAKAMRAAIPTVDSAASALAQTVAKYLKTGSPTEAGPMSDLDRWWTNLAPTLLASLDGSRIKDALSEAVTPSSRGFNPNSLTNASLFGGQHYNDTGRTEMLLERICKAVEKPSDPGNVEVHVPGSVGIDASVYRSRR